MKIFYIIPLVLILSCGVNKRTLHPKKTQTIYAKEDFTVTTEKFNPMKDATYYWYKSNEIQQSRGDYSGDALHGDYTRYYITNELAEKGKFNYGVKTNRWKSWYKNGQLKAVQNYYNGKLHGDFTLFSENGSLITRGKYYNNKKTGRWIDYISKDTTYYKRNKVFVKKTDSIKEEKPSFFKRLFMKREKSPDIKQKENREKNRKKPKNATLEPKTEKDSFFRRLFSKKKN